MSSSCFSTFSCSCWTVTYFWSMPVSSVLSWDLTCSSCASSSALVASSSCLETPPHPGMNEYDSTANTIPPSFFIRPPIYRSGRSCTQRNPTFLPRYVGRYQ